MATALGFVLFWPVTATDLAEGNEGSPEDPEQAGEHDEAFHASYARKFAQWQPDDPIDIYYCEFLLAQWVLDHAPWNAYHSAMGFKNNRTNETALFSFSPVDTSSVMNMVMPHIFMDSLWKSLIFGVALVEYKAGARMEFYPHWPDSYTNFVKVGRASGTMFRNFTDWVIDVFSPKHSEFQPIEVADVNRAVLATGSNNEQQTMTIVRSRMCHDFVTDALWFFYEVGARLKADDVIFRDHIIMYASAVEEIGPIGAGREKRRFLRYWRLIGLFLAGIKSQFTYARSALIAGWRLGLPVFLHDQWQDYEIHLVPPFLNYCYLPLAIPPQMHNPFATTKLCALGLEANATNTSAPTPWGPLLAVEERLDKPIPLLGFAAVVFAASAFASASVNKL